MPLDPVRVAETRAWLTKAHNDLLGAEHALVADPPLLGDVVFHCQQLAEKVLKAHLTWHDRPFRKTHSIEEIGEQAVQIDPTLRAPVDAAVPLTDYAWKFRYPGEPEEPTREEAEEAIAVARAVWDAVLERLPPDTRPR